MADLAEIRAWCDQARPLFICGLARSGTSMLQVAFARHAEMFNIKNCRETHIFVRPRTAVDDPIHVPTKLYLKSRENLMGYRQLVRELEKGSGHSLSESDLIRSFFWYASTAVYEGRQPLEKTPGHLKKISLMFELFPRAKVVVCSRDPVDVVASYRKRLTKSRAEGVSEDNLRWLDKTPQQMIDVFRRFTKLVQAARPEHGAAMFMAPYEWLVDSPEQALRQVCEFAQMPYSSTLLQPDSKDERPAEEAAPDTDSSNFDASAQITKRPSDAHKVLSADEIDLVSQATRAWTDLWRTPGVLG